MKQETLNDNHINYISGENSFINTAIDAIINHHGMDNGLRILNLMVEANGDDEEKSQDAWRKVITIDSGGLSPVTSDITYLKLQNNRFYNHLSRLNPFSDDQKLLVKELVIKQLNKKITEITELQDKEPSRNTAAKKVEPFCLKGRCLTS